MGDHPKAKRKRPSVLDEIGAVYSGQSEAITGKPDKAMLAPKAARHQLWKMIEPHINRDKCYLQQKGADRHGWIYIPEEVTRAIEAWRTDTDTLTQKFNCISEKRGTNRTYTRYNYTHLAVLLHRDDMVNVFAVDLDAKEEGRDFTAYRDRIAGFFGAADPLCFQSKGGKGIHMFFKLAKPKPLKKFIEWVYAWGFKDGFIEVTPRSEGGGSAGILLPNKGEKFLGGSIEGSLVESLPPAPPKGTPPECIEFLCGITEKGRRQKMVSVATANLAMRGMDEAKGKALLERGAELCGEAQERPKDTEKTIEASWAWGLAHPILDPTEDSIVDAVCEEHGQKMRYVAKDRQWYIWDGQYWKPEEVDEAKCIVRTFVKQDNKLKEFLTSYKIDAITRMLSYAEPVKAHREDMDKDHFTDDKGEEHWLLNVQNGTIDLFTGELREHRPEDFLTKMIPVEYNPKARPGLWHKTLLEIMDGDEDMVKALLGYFGYTLTGSVREEVFFFCHGCGKNGKSTVLSAVFDLLEPYAYPLELETITPTKFGGDKFEMANVVGMRMVMTPDLRENSSFDGALIKQLSSTDPKRARPMRNRAYKFTPTHKLWIYGNHLPAIDAGDKALERRIILIPFEQVFTRGDMKLKEKLKAKQVKEEILTSIVKGCLDWQKRGLRRPPKVRVAGREYCEENDWYKQIRESVFRPLYKKGHLDLSREVKASDLYWQCEQFLEESGERKVNRKELNSRLREAGFESFTKEGRLYFRGLELVNPPKKFGRKSA